MVRSQLSFFSQSTHSLVKLPVTQRQQQDENQAIQQQISSTLLTRRRSQFFSVEQRQPAISLSWAATTKQRPFANLGDALSPIMVSALSGLPIAHRHFDTSISRLACVGTIGQEFKNGLVHFWGTGVDRTKNPVNRSLRYYQRPRNTAFYVHALRGPLSAQTLAREGASVPPIYGDPVWFLPALLPPASQKQYELGIVVHLTELSELTDTATVQEKLLRYKIPSSIAADVKIVTTLTQPSFAAIEAKIQEITSCQRILSTSLHGLVIAEAYGIPCAHLRPNGRGKSFLKLADEAKPLDHRFRDFYLGVGLEKALVYGQPPTEQTNWDDAMQAIDRYWQPLNWTGEDFLEAFPLPLAFNPLKEKFVGDRSQFDAIRF